MAEKSFGADSNVFISLLSARRLRFRNRNSKYIITNGFKKFMMQTYWQAISFSTPKSPYATPISYSDSLITSLGETPLVFLNISENFDKLL